MNPPAEVSTSLKVYQGHTLEKTYVGEDFFWAVTPVAGDYILFKFDKPVNVERLVNNCHLSHIWSCFVPRMLEDRIWGCHYNLKWNGVGHLEFSWNCDHYCLPSNSSMVNFVLLFKFFFPLIWSPFEKCNAQPVFLWHRELKRSQLGSMSVWLVCF